MYGLENKAAYFTSASVDAMQQRDVCACAGCGEQSVDVLGRAAVDLWVLLGSGVISSSVATGAMVLSGVLYHVTASPCVRSHPGRSGS